VDGAGDQLLARPRFAHDEDGGIGRGYLLDLAQDAPDGVTAADDLAEVALQLCLFAQVDVLLLEPVFQQPNFFERTLQRLLGLLALGDVARDRQESRDPMKARSSAASWHNDRTDPGNMISLAQFVRACRQIKSLGPVPSRSRHAKFANQRSVRPGEFKDQITRAAAIVNGKKKASGLWSHFCRIKAA